MRGVVLMLLCLGGSLRAMDEGQPVQERPTLDSFLEGKSKGKLIAYIFDQQFSRSIQVLKGMKQDREEAIRESKEATHMTFLLQARLEESAQEKMQIKKRAQKIAQKLLLLQQQQQKTSIWLHRSMS